MNQKAEELYYILDSETTGELRLWWKPNHCGYTVLLDKAGVYTRAEAERIYKMRGTDIPYLKAAVDLLACRVILSDDFQIRPVPGFENTEGWP